MYSTPDGATDFSTIEDLVSIQKMHAELLSQLEGAADRGDCSYCEDEEGRKWYIFPDGSQWEIHPTTPQSVQGSVLSRWVDHVLLLEDLTS